MDKMYQLNDGTVAGPIILTPKNVRNNRFFEMLTQTDQDDDGFTRWFFDSKEPINLWTSKQIKNCKCLSFDV